MAIFTIRKDLVLHLLAAFLIIFAGRAYGYKILHSEDSPYPELYWDDSNLPIPFVINSAGTPDIKDSGDYSNGEFEAIRSAFQTWEEVPASYLCFFDYGIISREITNNDGVNLLVWRESEWPYEKDMIALNSTWYNSVTGEIVDTDIEFNGANFEWTDGPCSNNLVDVQNIAVHEIGHSLGLDDLYDEEDEECTMYGFVESLCEIKKRTLEQDDMDGISYLYPGIVVTIITPTIGDNEIESFPVTIYGKSFKVGATIEFTQDFRPDITVTSSTVVSSATISAELNLYGAPVGFWDVWVINPDPDGSKGFLSRGFEVVDSSGENFPPVAMVGIPYQTVKVGREVILDGSQSYDPDGDSLSYYWEVYEEPKDSSISLSAPYSVYPKFTPTQAGTYKIKLVVDDGKLTSDSDKAIITATETKTNGDQDKSEGCACKTIGASGTEGPRAATIFLNLLVFLLPLLLISLKRRFEGSRIQRGQGKINARILESSNP